MAFDLARFINAAEQDRRQNTLVTQRAAALLGRGIEGAVQPFFQNAVREDQQEENAMMAALRNNQATQRQERGIAANQESATAGREGRASEGVLNRAAALKRAELSAGARGGADGREILRLLKTANDPTEAAPVRAGANRQLRALGAGSSAPVVPDVQNLAGGLAEMAQKESRPTIGQPAQLSGKAQIARKLASGGPAGEFGALQDVLKARIDRPTQLGNTTARDRITGKVVSSKQVEGLLKRFQKKDPAVFVASDDAIPDTEEGAFLKEHIGSNLKSALALGLSPKDAIDRAVEKFIAILGDDARIQEDLKETLESRSPGVFSTDLNAREGVKTGSEFKTRMLGAIGDPFGIFGIDPTVGGEELGLKRIRRKAIFSETFIRAYAEVLMQQHRGVR